MNRLWILPALLIAIGCASERTAMAADWKAEADARIEKHRKGDFTLTVKDADGKVIPNARLDVAQTASHFHFGTCFTGDLTSTSKAEQNYREFILKHFNTLVSENEFKWYSTEKKRDVYTYDKAERQMQWAEKHGLAMRGHCLFWSKPKFVQKWVQNLSDRELREEIDERIERIVPKFKGRLIAWDVHNEMLDGSFYKDRLGAGIRVHMFKKAHKLDPSTPLYVNEYGVLDNDRKLNRYIDLIKRLKKAGAPIGGIGIQEHACERFAPDRKAAAEDADRPEREGRGPLIPADVYKRLDKLANEFDLPIHLTEISSRTADETQRADSLEMLFRVGYSHPKVDAILLWGFWAKRHWLGKNAALVDADWNYTEAGKRISNLLLKEWRTNTSKQTDADGKVTFRGFYGTYKVKLTDTEGNVRTGTVKLHPDSTSAAITLEPAGNK